MEFHRPKFVFFLVVLTMTGLAPSGVRGWNTQTPILRSRASTWKSESTMPSVLSPTASPTVLCAARTDDSDTTSEAEQPLSEADRKELVDALFKGTSSSRDPASPSSSTNNDDDDDISNKISGFLDKPFFNPYNYDEDDDSFVGKIANFAKNDYELFEAIFVACFFLLLITITKDLLRAQMAVSGIGGKMF